MPEGRDPLLIPRNLDTSSLAISLPLTSSSLVMERGVLYGVAAQSQSPIIIDPFDSSFLNYNLAVIAPSGSGKSYFTAAGAAPPGSGTEFLVIDPEDEYRAVSDAVGGAVVRLAASSPHRLNPLDLVAPDRDKQAGTEETPGTKHRGGSGQTRAALVAGAGPGGGPGVLDIYERALLDQALVQTYADAGITADLRLTKSRRLCWRTCTRCSTRWRAICPARLAVRLRRTFRVPARSGRASSRAART